MPKPRNWYLPSDCAEYQLMFDTVQEYLRKLCGYDDFVTGILSKQKGQTLRLAAIMNALFSIDDQFPLEQTIHQAAVKAAIDFVRVCGEHASLLSGRRGLSEVIASVDTGEKFYSLNFCEECFWEGRIYTVPNNTQTPHRIT